MKLSDFKPSNDNSKLYVDSNPSGFTCLAEIHDDEIQNYPNARLATEEDFVILFNNSMLTSEYNKLKS